MCHPSSPMKIWSIARFSHHNLATNYVERINWVSCMFDSGLQNLCLMFNAYAVCNLFGLTFWKLVEINMMMVMAIKRRTCSKLPVAGWRTQTAGCLVSVSEWHKFSWYHFKSHPKWKLNGETKHSTRNMNPFFFCSRQTFMPKLNWHDNANDYY